MTTSTIEDEGKAIAEALGVIYTGPQYHKGELYCHLFTDPLTGSTFAATNKGNAWARFFALREEFGAPLPDNIPPEWKDFTLKFRGNLAKAFKEMGWLPAHADPIIHEATPSTQPQEVKQRLAEWAKRFSVSVPHCHFDVATEITYDYGTRIIHLPRGLALLFSKHPEESKPLWFWVAHEFAHHVFSEQKTHFKTEREEEDRANTIALELTHIQRLEAIEVGQRLLPKIFVSPAAHPLVIERFPYPAPEYMDLGGEIGELKVKVPPPRGAKLDEGSVIRTSEKHDKAVEHLGYHSVSLTDKEIASLETRVPTDIELINESQDRLRKTKVIQDEQLSPLQLAHLNLARAIAEETDCVPPGGIYAAIIPPASDKVRTTGLYGTRTGTLYLSIEMLPKGRNAIDTLVHELGHHLQFTSTGEAEDLTPSHAGAMKSIAEKLTQGLNSGDYDKLLVTIVY